MNNALLNSSYESRQTSSFSFFLTGSSSLCYVCYGLWNIMQSWLYLIINLNLSLTNNIFNLLTIFWQSFIRFYEQTLSEDVTLQLTLKHVTYINTKMFSDASAMLSQHTERHAFFQKDAHFILILQLNLEIETHPVKAILLIIILNHI